MTNCDKLICRTAHEGKPTWKGGKTSNSVPKPPQLRGQDPKQSHIERYSYSYLEALKGRDHNLVGFHELQASAPMSMVEAAIVETLALIQPVAHICRNLAAADPAACIVFGHHSEIFSFSTTLEAPEVKRIFVGAHEVWKSCLDDLFGGGFFNKVACKATSFIIERQ